MVRVMSVGVNLCVQVFPNKPRVHKLCLTNLPMPSEVKRSITVSLGHPDNHLPLFYCNITLLSRDPTTKRS